MTVENESSLHLIQLDDFLLSQMQQCNCQIKGDPDDDAIFVTENESFLIKQVTTSNSLLILLNSNGDEKNSPVPPSSLINLQSTDVKKQLLLKDMTNNYWEFNRIKGKVDKILEIFKREFIYAGEESLQIPTANERYTMERLKQCIQASNAEIDRTLKKISIVELSDGFLYRLSDDFLFENVKLIISSFLFSEGVVNDDFFTQLENELSVESSIWLYFKNVLFFQNNQMVKENIVHCICRHLFQQKPCWQRDDLIHAIEHEISYAFEVESQFLSLICYEKMSNQANEKSMLWFLDDKYLPFEPVDRISVLFTINCRWKHSLIIPFMLSVCSDVKEAESLLGKSSRIITDSNGEKIFISKYLK